MRLMSPSFATHVGFTTAEVVRMEESCLAEEIEVLEAIYIHELEVDRGGNGDIKKIVLQLHPATGDDVEQQFVCMTLILDLPKSYPEDPPDITIKNPRGIGDEEVQSLLEDMHKLGRERTGGAMLYELIELAKDSLTLGNMPHCACMICLEHFSEGDSFTRTECYHYFHESCLARYTRHALAAQPEEQAAYARHAKTEQHKLVCPVCREEIEDRSEELPHVVEEDKVVFTPSQELRAMQSQMAAMFERQKAKGGIIDVEAERNKYLVKKDDVVLLKSVASDPNIQGMDDPADRRDRGNTDRPGSGSNRRDRGDNDRPSSGSNRRNRGDTGSGRDTRHRQGPRVDERHDRGKRRPGSGYDRDKGRDSTGFVRGKGRGRVFDDKPYSDDEAMRRNFKNRDRYNDRRREPRQTEDARGNTRGETRGSNSNEKNDRKNESGAKSANDSDKDSKSETSDPALSKTNLEKSDPGEVRKEKVEGDQKQSAEAERWECLNEDKGEDRDKVSRDHKLDDSIPDSRGKDFQPDKKYDRSERNWRDRKESGNRPILRQSDRGYGRNDDRNRRNYRDRDFGKTDERYEKSDPGEARKEKVEGDQRKSAEAERSECMNEGKGKGRDKVSRDHKLDNSRPDSRGKEFQPDKKYDRSERNWRDRNESGNRPNSRQSDRGYGRNDDRNRRNYRDEHFAKTDKRSEKSGSDGTSRRNDRTYRDNNRSYRDNDRSFRDKTYKDNDRTFRENDKLQRSDDHTLRGKYRTVPNDVSNESDRFKEVKTNEDVCDKTTVIDRADTRSKTKDKGRIQEGEKFVPNTRTDVGSGRRPGRGRGRARHREEAIHEDGRIGHSNDINQNSVDSVEKDLRNMKVSKTDRTSSEHNNFHEKTRNRQKVNGTDDKESVTGGKADVVEKASGPPGFKTKPPPGFDKESAGAVKPPPGF